MSSAERPTSLGRRLLWRTLAALCVVWVVNAVLVLEAAQIEIREDLDDSLERAATLLMGFAEHEYAESGGRDLDDFSEPASLPRGLVIYQVWSARGRLLMRSQDAPTAPLSEAVAGYADLRVGDEDWRLFTVWNKPRTLRLQIAEPQWHRREIAGDLSLALLAPLLLGVPLLALSIGLALRRGLAPVRDAAQAVAERGGDDFSPLAEASLPRELQALVKAFNGLLQRLAQALEGERRFTEDVAHELRTPLAAIRLQAQVASRASAPEAAQAALQKLVSGVDRIDRVVDQLLTLARLDPTRAADLQTEDFPLRRVVEETLSEFEGAAAQRQVQLLAEVEIEGGVVHGSPQAIYVVLRNLVDNALRHAPAGSRVQVSARAADGLLELAVRDEGPGIPPAARRRVFERFVRLQPGSSGLGLFIVQRIAQLFGGVVGICDSEGGGCQVVVRWPVGNRSADDVGHGLAHATQRSS